MFWKFVILLVALYVIREACVNPIFRILLNCEDTLHLLYRYCAISQSNPYFLDYYKANQELERRENAVKRIDELKISNFRKMLMTPNEKRYYNEFVAKIPCLKVDREKYYKRYKDFQERYVEEKMTS